MNVSIVRAGREDLGEILKLQYLAYRSEAARFNDYNIQPLTETLEELEEEFDRGVVLKMTGEDGGLIGSVRAYLKDGTAYIGKLMVDPAHQHRGYGSMLIRAVEDCYPCVRYELFTSTRSIENIRLYEKLGYRIFDRRAVTEEIIFVYLEKKGEAL